MVEGAGDLTVPEAYVGYVAGIVTAYVANHSVDADDLPSLIRTVYDSLRDLTVQRNGHEPQPAVSIESSIGEDFLVCLEDGRRFKSLRRHLRTKYDMTPEEYRAKWGLPKEYPMVAPGYSKQRSKLAKDMGLGRAIRD